MTDNSRITNQDIVDDVAFKAFLEELPTADVARFGVCSIEEDPSKFTMFIILDDRIKVYLNISELLEAVGASLKFLSPA